MTVTGRNIGWIIAKVFTHSNYYLCLSEEILRVDSSMFEYIATILFYVIGEYIWSIKWSIKKSLL